eukprot:717652-Rhodomonas_salina.1
MREVGERSPGPREPGESRGVVTFGKCDVTARGCDVTCAGCDVTAGYGIGRGVIAEYGTGCSVTLLGGEHERGEGMLAG